MVEMYHVTAVDSFDSIQENGLYVVPEEDGDIAEVDGEYHGGLSETKPHLFGCQVANRILNKTCPDDIPVVHTKNVFCFSCKEDARTLLNPEGVVTLDIDVEDFTVYQGDFSPIDELFVSCMRLGEMKGWIADGEVRNHAVDYWESFERVSTPSELKSKAEILIREPVPSEHIVSTVPIEEF